VTNGYRDFALLAATLLVLTPAAAWPSCPGVTIDILDSKQEVLDRRTSSALTDTRLYLFAGYGGSGQQWSFDWFDMRQEVAAWSEGSNFGIRMTTTETFTAAAGATLSVAPQTLMARLHLDLETDDYHYLGVAYHPAGGVRAELTAGGGHAMRDRPIAGLTGPVADVLFSQPFNVTPGVPFEVSWSVGAYGVTGFAELQGRLDFVSLDGATASVLSCHGTRLSVTPVRPATWSGVKALLH
jgi:hypothetical protein